MPNIRKITLREKCPNTEFLLVLFLNTEFLYVFSPNAGKYGPEKLRIWTLFTQCNKETFLRKIKQQIKVRKFD